MNAAQEALSLGAMVMLVTVTSAVTVSAGNDTGKDISNTAQAGPRSSVPLPASRHRRSRVRGGSDRHPANRMWRKAPSFKRLPMGLMWICVCRQRRFLPRRPGGGDVGAPRSAAERCEARPCRLCHGTLIAVEPLADRQLLACQGDRRNGGRGILASRGRTIVPTSQHERAPIG